MATGEKIQLEAWLHQEGSAIKKSSNPPPKKADQTENVGVVVRGEGREGREGGREKSPEAQQHFEKSVRLPSAAFTTADLV